MTSGPALLGRWLFVVFRRLPMGECPVIDKYEHEVVQNWLDWEKRK